MKHEDSTQGALPPSVIDTDEPFCVGHWRVEPRAHQVSGPAGCVHLTPKAMQVLCCLAATPGRVGTKEELLATVWAGTVVTESVVARAVSELRRTLGDDASDPHVIETIPTVGYRLIASVTVPTPAVPSVSLAESRPSDKKPERRRGWPYRGVVLAVLSGLLLMALVSAALTQGYSEVAFEVERFMTMTVGEERTLSTSLDGKQVVFVKEEKEGRQVDLYVQAERGALSFRLTNTPEQERSPAWSPDSRYVGFVQTSQTTCGLYIIPAQGGRTEQLSSCEPGLQYHVEWTEDGAWVTLVEYNPQRKPERITMLPVPDAPPRLPATSLLLIVP